MHMPPTGLYEAPLPTDWPEPEALGFGRVLGPYIAHAQHGEDGGWHAPCVSARNALPVPVASGGLQYGFRSEEHTSELQSLMRISYAVFCLKKKKLPQIIVITHITIR